MPVASPACHEADAPAVTGTTLFRVALLGNPNTGKTTLFNRLCGVLSKTSNYPGTTTRARTGRCQAGERPIEVVDLPGVYRLSLEVPESRVCRSALQGETARRPDLAVVVLDATNLARNLVLLGELMATGVPAIAALNMVDLAQKRGLTFDTGRLSALLGCPVVPMVARRGQGLAELQGPPRGSAAGGGLRGRRRAARAGGLPVL